MSEIEPHDETFLRRIDDAIANRSPWLRFPDELERRYRSDAMSTNTRHARYAGWAAVVAYNVMLAAEFAAGDFSAHATPFVLLASQGLVTAPWLAFVGLAKFIRNPRRLDEYMGAAYALVTLASLFLNLNMADRPATYDAFTSVLIPVTCNIALPLSFAMAARGSAFSVTALIAMCLARSGFSSDAQSAMILLYLVGATVTLVANYRYEWVSRTHYLNCLRQAVLNADIARANATLTTISRTDFLTGLANRRDFDERFNASLTRCLRERTSLTVLLIDIDHFKWFNDQHGHIEGDVCLRSVAQAIATTVERAGGFTGRFGGEEFAVLLPILSSDATTALAERIRASVKALGIANVGPEDQGLLSVSIGVAALNPAYPETANELLSRADAALYRAKRGGRDRAEVDLLFGGARHAA